METEKITLYTSNFCAHAWLVENLIREHEIPATIINVDEDSEARDELLHINDGMASVPTLIFADGSKMIEPPIRKVKEKLGIADPGLLEQLRGWLKGPG